MLKLLFKLIKILLILTLPFLALIRGTTFLHVSYDLGKVLSLIGGALLAAVVLTIYMTVIYERFTDTVGGIRAVKSRGIFAMVILIGFCIHGIFFFSSANLKNDGLAKEMRQLHPVLRLSLSTIALMDKSLIVTDASRVPEDYRKMGLPTKQSSLHYLQKDGYAYAVDLRTKRRSALRNSLLRNYFRLMGFKTLRHVGTDDHLHVSLHCHYRPRSK